VVARCIVQLAGHWLKQDGAVLKTRSSGQSAPRRTLKPMQISFHFTAMIFRFIIIVVVKSCKRLALAPPGIAQLDFYARDQLFC
jgi:hypothetical protein